MFFGWASAHEGPGNFCHIARARSCLRGRKRFGRHHQLRPYRRVKGTFALGTISGSNSLIGFTPGTWSNAGSGNEDGFGSFNLRITSFDGWSHSSTEISFGIGATGTNSWSSASQVLTGNNKDQIAAIHLFPCIPSGTGCASNSPGATSITGFASHAVPVPIPAAVWLFGSGLLGLIGIARRRIGVSNAPATA